MSGASSASTVDMKAERARRRPSEVSTASSVPTLHGDRRQRITVPMPRSVDELHAHASRFRINNMELYHHGKKQIFHQGHVEKLDHNHTVVVTGWEERPKEAFPSSTHADTFKAHRIEPRRAAPPPSRAPPAPFEGQATSADYKAHRIEPRRAAPRPEASKSEPFLGNSTHKLDYQPHKIEPRRVADRPAPGKSEPFDGTRTSDDFKAHEIRPRSARPAPAPGKSEPFLGTSSYGDAFKPHQVNVSKPYQRPEPAAPTKFEGTSEYLHRYLEHQIPKRDVLHIEPALVHRPRGLRARRPVSARY